MTHFKNDAEDYAKFQKLKKEGGFNKPESGDFICKLKSSRVNYIKKLIKGTKESAQDHMGKYHPEIISKHPESVCVHIADSLLLCAAIEKLLI